MPTSSLENSVEVKAPSADSPSQIGGDLAHELNNILTIIQGYADRLLLKHGDNPALRPDLKLISTHARRAAEIIRQAKAPKPPLATPVA